MVFEDNSEGMRNSCSVLCSFSYASVVCVSVGSCISLCCDTLFFRFTLHSHKPTQQKSNSLKGPSNTRQRNIQLCLHEMNTRKSLVKGERFIRFVSVSATDRNRPSSTMTLNLLSYSLWVRLSLRCYLLSFSSVCNSSNSCNKHVMEINETITRFCESTLLHNKDHAHSYPPGP